MGRWRGPTTRRCRRAWTLVATAAYVDPDFVQKAVRLVADHSTYFKSIVPLAETSRRARLNRAGGQHGGSQSARGSHDRQRQLRHHRLGLASEPARSLRVDVSTAGLNDSFEALKSHRRKTALGSISAGRECPRGGLIAKVPPGTLGKSPRLAGEGMGTRSTSSADVPLL